MLRRNRSFVFKLVVFVPLTWLCVVLYMNSSSSGPGNGGNAGGPIDEQIVYIQDANKFAEEAQQQQKQLVNEKQPPLKNNQWRKNKLTPPGELDAHYFEWSNDLLSES